jgi:hypothetical protein
MIPAGTTTGRRIRTGIACGVLAVAGCQPRGVDPAPPPDRPAYAALARAQAERVGRLARIHAEGVVEVRWVEGTEKRLVQGDVSLWLRRPRHTALRVSKLGDDLLWLGSDQDRFWLFDFLGEERVLYTGDHESELAEVGPARLSFRPLVLLDLAGLVTLPEEGDHEVSWSAEHRGWSVTVPGGTGPLRVIFEPATLLPRRVEVLGPDGSATLLSTLAEDGRMPLPGESPYAGPMFPQVIRISDAEGSGVVSLFLRDEREGDVSDAMIERICDLDRLVKSLGPQRIVRGDRG